MQAEFLKDQEYKKVEKFIELYVKAKKWAECNKKIKELYHKNRFKGLVLYYNFKNIIPDLLNPEPSNARTDLANILRSYPIPESIKENVEFLIDLV